MNHKYILGISCFYHDSAAALICDGDILGAVQEERFSRIKNDSSFPRRSIEYLLESNNLKISDIDSIIYYEKPLITFERLIETHLFNAPFGLKFFWISMTTWMKEKFNIEKTFKRELSVFGGQVPDIKYSEHHLSHAASAFYPSAFESAIVLCLDGVGEWATTTAWLAKGNHIRPVWEIHFPHSLGLFYAAITAYLGFKVNSGEYKVMGLAPYGEPRFEKLMMDNLISLHDDGSFELNLKYFDYCHDLKMYSRELELLFGKEAREPESNLEQFHMDVAASLQKVLETAIIHIAKNLKNISDEKNLCLAGGVALNCVANSKIYKETHFEDIWVQPSAGDAGGALGAALAYWHIGLNNKRVRNVHDSQKGSYLGPEFSNDVIEKFLNENKIEYSRLQSDTKYSITSDKLSEGKIIGWFQGRMEFGPRALGHRSILGDARVLDMQKKMNLKIKFRESFRPFAPIVLEEDASDIFVFNKPSPYMLFVAPIHEKYRVNKEESSSGKFGIDKLNEIRSSYPAITHVDYSARLQTISKERNPEMYNLLRAYKVKTGASLLVNTSFNVRGEPIVCSPLDAYNCFKNTDIDILVMGDFMISKESTLPSLDNSNGKIKFGLD